MLTNQDIARRRAVAAMRPTTKFFSFPLLVGCKISIFSNFSDIDMSAAFDTINRRHLLDIVKSIVDEDEHRQIQFLLSGTVIDTRIDGTST